MEYYFLIFSKFFFQKLNGNLTLFVPSQRQVCWPGSTFSVRSTSLLSETCLLVWLQASMVKCDSPFSLITSLQYTFNWSFQHHPIKLALSSTLMHWGFFSSFYRLLINRCSHLSCFVHCANHTLPMSKCRHGGLQLTLIVLLLLGFKSIFFHIFWVSSLFTNVFCKSFL